MAAMETRPPETPPPALPPSARLPLPVRRTPAVWLATGLGVGFAPVAPGTLGAAMGVGLAWAVGQLPMVLAAGAILLLLGAGVPLCTAAARDLGGIKDPGAIIYDEIVTLPVTFFLVPMDTLTVLVAGFVLHRVFDISKPPPARRLERLPKGLGIMADDVAAGIYSNLVLHLVLWSGVLPATG